MRFTFTKEERLTNKSDIDELFKKGRSLSSPAFRLLWKQADEKQPFPVKVLISVPKKAFHKANKRNILRRRIREAYRKNKHLIYKTLDEKKYRILLIVLYIEKNELSFMEIEQKLILSLNKLVSRDFS